MPGACISPGKMIQFHLRGDCIGFPDVVPDLLRYWRTGADFNYRRSIRSYLSNFSTYLSLKDQKTGVTL